MTELDKLLAVAEPEEWDLWLASHVFDVGSESVLEIGCLFCAAFKGPRRCVECRGGFATCLDWPRTDRYYAAWMRLRRVGVL